MRFKLLLILLSIGLTSFGQQAKNNYKFRVYLNDKGHTPYSISEPEKFLTQAAIQRKKRQNVSIDSSDLPISSDYFSQLTKAGGKVVAFSKWFQTITVELSDSAQIENITALPFVASAKYVWRGTKQMQQNNRRPRLQNIDCLEDLKLENPLGVTHDQFVLHNAAKMILNGFTGKGINIAVIDAGFTNVDVIPFFDSVEISGTKNFVPTGEIYDSNDHGTNVLSTMSIFLPNIMMGSAPSAKYWLLRSEDATSEFPVEEDYWVRAVEYADSIGIDLINTSLGYTDFDDSTLNYRHEDLDGKTSFMTLATDRAFEKGMLLVNSAGNEGNKKWRKISPPADAQFALTVGAVATDSIIAPFSSQGYSADNRVKPDVVSVGHKSITIGQNGNIRMANGTSFSSPFMAGLVASLWSINPAMSRSELLDIVKQSADRYHHPDSIYGYGIPNFGKAMHEVLKRLPENKKTFENNEYSISKLSKNNFRITLNNPVFLPRDYRVRVLDENGHLISSHEFESESANILLSSEVRKRNKAIHFVFETPSRQETTRFRL